MFHPVTGLPGSRLRLPALLGIDGVTHAVYRYAALSREVRPGGPDDTALAVQKAGYGVGGVTFGRDPLVPVVIRIRRILEFDIFQPGIFPGRLVKMAVEANISVHQDKSWRR
jgi:hypothetical protein